MRSRPMADVKARNAGHLRGLNLETVLSVAMQREGSFTRAELIEATGLSAPTVGTLVSHLMQTGIVKDLGTGPSRGGRRPSFMEFNARHGYVAGIDLGPTRTRLAVADLRGERLADRIIPTPVRLGPAALLSRVAGALRALMEEAGAQTDRLLAVGAGAPGAVDREKGIVTFAPNLHDWSHVPMRDILERALQAPVQVENDVNLAVLGEHWRGAARGHDTCVFIFVGTGIGAGVLIDGELHHGHHFMAGEIAVMCMGPQFIDVEFGERGCFETLAGLHALADLWPEASQADPAGWVPSLFEAALAGDRKAKKIVDETARLIAIAVANVGAVVDPSLIVLGGALFAQAESLVHDVRKIVERIRRSPMEIVSSALGKEAPLSGCLLVASNDARQRLRHGMREARVSPIPVAAG
ncbi:MAG TPA: ROK family transcriptional regulator [Vicinamibacteria bacterium]|nr:ROK family transcriptional regulator [Vicinamibacteria bacterium]